MEVEPFGVETWGSHVKRTPPLSFPPTVNIKAVQLVYLLMIKIVYIYIFLPIYTRTNTHKRKCFFIYTIPFHQREHPTPPTTGDE